MKRYFFSFILAFLVFIPLGSLSADVSVGVSPSRVIADLQQGEKKEFIINITRSEIIDEMKFEVSVEEPVDYILLTDKIVIFKPGEQEKQYHFFVDSASLNPELYKNIISFVHIADTNGQQVAVRYGISVRTAITILPPAPISPAVVPQVTEKPIISNQQWIYITIAIIIVLLAVFLLIIAFFHKKRSINHQTSDK